jgi:hypothetical protein
MTLANSTETRNGGLLSFSERPPFLVINEDEETCSSAAYGTRAVSIHMLSSEDRARCHFLEENGTSPRGFCKEQNRNRCNAVVIGEAAV